MALLLRFTSHWQPLLFIILSLIALNVLANQSSKRYFKDIQILWARQSVQYQTSAGEEKFRFFDNRLAIGDSFGWVFVFMLWPIELKLLRKSKWSPRQSGSSVGMRIA